MNRRTKIICTLGPASQRKSTMLKMVNMGMNTARINMSHGGHLQHQRLINSLREINKKFKHNIKVLQDLMGYRIRVGELVHPIRLKDCAEVWMTYEHENGIDEIPLDLDDDIKKLKKGMDVFIDDGMIHLKVVASKGKKIKLEVIHGGLLKSRKGVNIPNLKLSSNILTEKDQKDIEFGIKNKVDFIALSFVRNKSDILRVVRLVKPRMPECKVIAKIENKQGVKNIDAIIDVCDGIMIARGDLGVSLPIYEVPFIQKDIILRCNFRKRMVVVATQMLESMSEYTRPTRAEVSDVTNAILDGTSAVMLSGETAAGKFPVKCVRMMRHIIEHTEKNR